MRINRVNKEDTKIIKNIAKNNDMTMNVFLAKELRKITEKYPNEIKLKKKPITCVEVRVDNISPTVACQFETIAHNKGLTTSQLLTLHLSDIKSRYPLRFQRFEE